MSCPTKHKSKKKKRSSGPVLLSFLLLILPKCPFCFVAYSSAIAVCGIGEHGLSLTESILIYGLILIIVVMLSFNYRGTKTIVALSLVTIGGLLIASSQLWGTNLLADFTLASYLILAGVFLNSGLPAFIKSLYLRITAHMKRATAEAYPVPETSKRSLFEGGEGGEKSRLV